jgi:hypothetical protein
VTARASIIANTRIEAMSLGALDKGKKQSF